MSEQMTRVTDVVDLLNKVCFVQYNTGWSSTSLAKDVVREITRLRQLLSEADKREKEARAKLQAMHRRAQQSERVENMLRAELTSWLKIFETSPNVWSKTRRLLIRVIIRELDRRVRKIAVSSALQLEER